MKKTLFITAVLLLISIRVYSADFSEVYGVLSEESLESINAVLPEFDFQDIIKSVTEGNFSYDLGGILGRIFTIFASEIKNTLSYMSIIVVLAVFWGIIESFEGGKTVKSAAFICVFSMIAGVLIAAFNESGKNAEKYIKDVSDFFTVLIPVLTAFLASSGGVGAAASIHPLIMMLFQMLSSVINSVFIPVIYATFALTIANALGENGSLTGVINLLKGFVKWGVSLILTIFGGILSVQGMLCSEFDSITVKTAKFLVGGSVPIVGGVMSDSIDMLTSSGMLLKNTFGTAGLVVIILMSVLPVIKMAAPVLVFKVCSAAIISICTKRLSNAVEETVSALSMVLVCGLSVTVFSVAAISIILKAVVK